MPAEKRKLTPEDKARVLEFGVQGVPIPDIARELNCKPHQIAGVITSARNRGTLPKLNKNSQETLPMQTLPPASNGPHLPQPQSAVHPSAHPASDGLEFRQGQPAGYSYSGQSTKYLIERIAPHDGLLGSQTTSPHQDEIGRMYGAGTYRITKQEPGKLPMQAECTIGESYGKPRAPRMVSDTVYGGRRQEREEEQDGHAPLMRRPFMPYSPDMQPRSAAGDAVAAKAVEALGDMNRRAIEQVEKLQAKGPDSYMQTFLTEQQTQWRQRQEEERERWQREIKDREAKEERERKERAEKEERERKEREVAEDRRRKEDEEKWRRHQQEERDRHERELDRIKRDIEAKAELEREQRKTFLEVEQKKTELFERQAKIREDEMRRELERSREEVKAARQAVKEESESLRKRMEEQMQGVQASVQEDIDNNRKALHKEHEIRMAALNREHELMLENLKLREEFMRKSGGDDFAKMVGKVVEELGRAAKEVVDLKKIEAMSPEAHAAQISRGVVDGNVVAPPESHAPQSPMAEGGIPVPQRPAEAHAEGNGNGNGAPAPAAIPSNGSAKRDIVKEFLGSSEVRPILDEWVRHVREGTTPALFGTMFMEFMSDQEDHKLRKASTVFANYMSARSWAHMFEALRPHLAEEDVAVFSTKEAEEFYETFRAFVVERVREYTEQFFVQRAQVQAQKAQAMQQAVAQDAAANPVEAAAPA